MAISSIGPPASPPAAAPAREANAVEQEPTPEPDELAGAEPQPGNVEQPPLVEDDRLTGAEGESNVAGQSAPPEPDSGTEERPREPEPGSRLDVTA